MNAGLTLRRRPPVLGIECRVELFHTSGGNAVCYVYNRDGTYRIPPFMLYADPRHNALAAEPPSGHFCRHRDRCAGLSRCPLEYVCND